MKFLFEMDDEEDFVEIHLTERELMSMLKGDPLVKDVPQGLNRNRNLNIYIRRGANAISQREE